MKSVNTIATLHHVRRLILIAIGLLLLTAASLDAQQTPIADPSESDLAAEVQQLRQEVQELRNQPESRSVAATDLLPPAIDPQRMLRSKSSNVQAGDFRGAFLVPGTDVSLRIGGYARFDMMYDTGYLGSGLQLFPSTIALDDSPLAGRRGRTQVTGSQSRLYFDAQAKTDVGKLQGFVELDFLQDDTNPRLRHAYGEWSGDRWEIVGGQTWSTFMDPGAVPFTIPETTAAGAVFARQPQLRLTRKFRQHNSFSVSVEDPVTNDFTLPSPTTDQRLERWPDFVSRVVFANPDLGSFQVASIVRGIGFEDQFGTEHLRTGWGVSATARWNVSDCDTFRCGVVGGRGVGSYVAAQLGELSAAAPDLGGFRTLDALGAFAAYQHEWSETFSSGFYYGYADAESTPLMAATAVREIQNAGLNFVWSPRPNFGVGIEYNVSSREVRDGQSADNNRIQFGIQFGP